MPVRMAAADVVINRAGAMTLSELALLGRASILIPSPNVTNNHQYKNAAVLRDAGAAMLFEEKDLTPGVLTGAVEKLCSDSDPWIHIAPLIQSKNADRQAFCLPIRVSL